ncbi:hypothetical protein A2U01_0112649, partial [Trifolium medium]|nr:hypothetical protein [Trifolium medium]
SKIFILDTDTSSIAIRAVISLEGNPLPSSAKRGAAVCKPLQSIGKTNMAQ